MNASVLESTVDEGAAAIRPKFLPLRGNLDAVGGSLEQYPIILPFFKGFGYLPDRLVEFKAF